MYIPEHFAESRPEVLRDFLRAHPLATIVVSGADGLDANHVPLSLRPELGAQGRLLGHVARANPLWQVAGDGADCLAIFHGPQHYISPNGYASKAIDGKAVPTWNYSAVHVKGRITSIDDPAWLRGFLEQLTREHEANQTEPWKIEDAPPEFVDRMIRGIVGLSIEIGSIFGKSKLSQNQPKANRVSLVELLRSNADPHALEMADEVERASRAR